MYPPIFVTVKDDATVQASFGSSPCRVYPFGKVEENTTLPYAAWRTISGLPENYLGTLPDIDSWSIQIDVYASTATAARDGAEALRDAIEGSAHIVAWRGESQDPQTKNYRYSFDVDWFVNR